MSHSLFKRKKGGESDCRPPVAMLRSAGRVALWAAVGVLLVRGAEGVLAAPAEEGARAPVGRSGPGGAAEAIAAGFARAWLEDPDPRALTAYLAEGAHLGKGTAPSETGQVAQAEVIDSKTFGGGRWVLTVSCDLRDARTLYLAVPIVRRGAGEAAVMGAPSIVAVPATAGADPERPRPIAGPEAAAIGGLIERFLPAYLSVGKSSELSYYLTPGTEVVPLGGALEPLGSPTVVQVGEGEGPRREVIASQRVQEPGSGAVYPLAYRLRVVERAGRWYVAAVEGAVA
jgi:Conjugative transposon protein TcpC